jgi:hypothetical protein
MDILNLNKFFTIVFDIIFVFFHSTIYFNVLDRKFSELEESE